MRTLFGHLQVLLVHGTEKESDYWGFPKGIQDNGEAIETTAVREIVEETGILSELICLLGVSKYTYTYEGELWDKTVNFYLAKQIGEIPMRDNEYHDVRWVTITDALSLLTYDSDKEILKKAQQMIEQVDLYKTIFALNVVF